jgi:hypothetical protein
VFSVVISGLLLASPALAQSDQPRASRDHGIDTTPSDTARSGDTNAQGERLICRSVASSSTSRMGQRRVCHTAAEWRVAQRTD